MKICVPEKNHQKFLPIYLKSPLAEKHYFVFVISVIMAIKLHKKHKGALLFRPSVYMVFVLPMTVWIKRYIDFAWGFFPAFPVIHSSTLVTHDVVNNYSLLYKVQGSNPALRPYMLCAHLDVVPVNRDAWEEDPFGANFKDGFIYARGTIDVKQIVMVCLYNVKICDASKLASICKFTIIDKIADYFIACRCIGFTSVVLLRGRLIANER